MSLWHVWCQACNCYFCELPDTGTAQLLDLLCSCFMMRTTGGALVFFHVGVEQFYGCVHGICNTWADVILVSLP